MTNDITQLAQDLADILAAKTWQITCAESCTGGGVGYAITSISGSSAWFKKGFITYSNEAKTQLLHVQPSTLADYGAVSKQTVEEMAKGAAKQAGAQVAVSVSGIAGPDGGSADKPVGTVWFGFYVDGNTSSECQLIRGDRQAVRLGAIKFVLSHLVALLAK